MQYNTQTIKIQYKYKKYYTNTNPIYIQNKNNINTLQITTQITTRIQRKYNINTRQTQYKSNTNATQTQRKRNTITIQLK